MKWTPQPGPQAAFVISQVFEVIYGGARGGGKTDGVLGDFKLHAQRHDINARGLLVRRTQTALGPTISRAREIYRGLATWKAAQSRFDFRNGAVLYFRHLDNDADADLYQGHDYTRVYVEELTQFPRPGPVDKLKATLRSAAGTPCGFRATCNPGGAGHAWVKARYIDAGPHEVVREAFLNPFDGSQVMLDRVFIPARLTDNPLLLKRDPKYVARLRLSGSDELVRAWLEGDWNAALGAFFDKWSMRNIVAPFIIPDWWTRFRSFDWGHASPFAVGWWAVAGDDWRRPEGVIPRGALVRYREWYGADRMGAGLRLETEAIAAGILERERAAGERIEYGVADPSIFAHAGGPSIGERMAMAGVCLAPADNRRVGEAGAMCGWDQMRARIKGVGERPMLYVFDTCRDFIRTVPTLPHDPMRAEDVDTRAEDHIADETRYACMSRPWIAPPTGPRPTRSIYEEYPFRDDYGRRLGWKIL